MPPTDIRNRRGGTVLAQVFTHTHTHTLQRPVSTGWQCTKNKPGFPSCSLLPTTIETTADGHGLCVFKKNANITK